MNKKWVLVLLFSFSNNIMHAEAELNENISLVQNESVEKIIKLALEESDKKIEEKSLSRWQRLKRTVKSDLCIGDDIIEHKTFGSQLKAGFRLFGYSRILQIAFMGLTKSLSSAKLRPQFASISNVGPTDAQILSVAFFITFIVPLYEEALFTYGPQYLGKAGIKDDKMRSYFNLLPTVLFGLAHYTPGNDDFFINRYVVMTGIVNHLHQRYLLKRKANKVPVLHHVINNGVSMSVGLAAYYFLLRG